MSVNVETLTAKLEMSGLAAYRAAAAQADAVTDRIKGNLGAVTAVSRVATDAVQNVKMTGAQAAETEMAGRRVESTMEKITRKAGEARRAVESVRLAGLGGGGPGGVDDGRNGAGVGPIGSGFGRIGVLGTAIGAGVLTAPAAAPAALGVLAALPTLLGAVGGALGTVVLASQGVVKAIGGDKDAFDKLGPSAQRFVETIRSLTGYMHGLEQTAQNALFPGLEQALHSALSPPLLNAVSQAVHGFGQALGAAAEQWGKYFGSNQFVQLFGPLMQAGARTVGTLSDTLLHLADSVGVIARAAIPFTTWITGSIDAGARFVDTWLRAKDATGQLGGAMTEAQTSLTLVAKLVESLGRVVVSLGAALYPVSKVAVADLTDGLDALAGIIQRNKAGIQEFVGGALTAVVTTVKTATPLVEGLATVLGKVVGAMGGWRVAFELVIAGTLATKFVSLAKTVTGAFAAMTDTNPVLLAIAALATGALLIIENWSKVKKWFDDFGVWLAQKITAVVGFIGNALSKIPSWLPGLGKFHDWGERMQSWATSTGQKLGAELGEGISDGVSAAMQNVAKITAAEFQALTSSNPGVRNAALAKAGFTQQLIGPDVGTTATKAGYRVSPGVDIKDENAIIPLALAALAKAGYDVDVTSGYRTYKQQAALYARYVKSGFNNRYIAAKPGTSNHESGNAVDVYVNGKPVDQSAGALAILKQYGLVADVAGDHEHLDLTGYSGTSTGMGGDLSQYAPTGSAAKPPSNPVIPAHVTSLLNEASANASKAKQLGDAGGTAARYLQDQLADLKAAQAQLEETTASTPAGKAQISKALTSVENKIRDVQTAIKNAVLVTGDALLPQQLKAKLTALTSKFQADSAYAQSLTGTAAENYASVLRTNLIGQETVLTREVTALKGKLAASTGRQRTAVQTELTKVQGQLGDVQQQILSSLQSNVQTLQARVSSLFSAVTSQLDSAFDAQTQAMIDKVAQADFQNGAQTPLEAQLAAMQAADTLKGYTDAVAQAQAAGDQAALAAAQRQLDEYNLSIQAAAERTRADSDYAAKVRDIQAARTAAEDQMNAHLAALGDAFQNGTGTMGALRDIAAAYGLQITTDNVPAFQSLSDAMVGKGGLIDAFQQLADYIAKITGNTPAKVGGSSSGGGGGSGGGSSSPSVSAVTAYALAIAAIAAATGNVYTHGAIPQFADGGPTKEGLAYLHDDEYVVPKGGVLVKGAGKAATPVQVSLVVQALDPDSVDWNAVGEKAVDGVYAALIRKRNRNGGKLGLG